MRFLQRLPARGLPVVLVGGILIGWLVAQQVGVTPSAAQPPADKMPAKLAASDQPPPGLQKLEEGREEAEANAPRRKGPKSREEVLTKLRSLKGEGRPASDQPPPGLLEPGEGEAGEPPGRARQGRPSREELIEKVRGLPGGQDMLDKARGPKGMILEETEFALAQPDWPGLEALAWLNPFNVEPAEAQAAFSLWLEKSNNWYSSSPYGYLQGYGAYAGQYYVLRDYIGLLNLSFAPFGTQISRPYYYLVVTVPSDGWYIVNFEAYGTNNVRLYHYEGGSFVGMPTAWSSYGWATQDYPFLVNLAAGRHYFALVVTASTFYLYGAGAYSL